MYSSLPHPRHIAALGTGPAAQFGSGVPVGMPCLTSYPLVYILTGAAMYDPWAVPYGCKRGGGYEIVFMTSFLSPLCQ